MKIIIEKGDSKEQMMMAEAMLANKMVSSIERANYEINVVPGTMMWQSFAVA